MPADSPTVLTPELADLARQIERLTDRIETLEKRTAKKSEWEAPEDCRKHQCTYYEHYLARGPADLTHEGFHAAEKQCMEAQRKQNAFMDTHAALYSGTDSTPFDTACEFWEKQVRA